MTKKKIAILTQPLGHNYGGIIQNYALRKALKDLCCDSITINRIDENPHSKIKHALSFIKQYISSKKSSNDTRLIYKELYDFLKSNIFLSQKIETTEGLRSEERRVGKSVD